MLESLITLKELYERPWLAFIWATILCSVAIIVSAQVSYYMRISGASLAGIFAVIFTLIPSVYFATMLIKKEEILEEFYVKKHYKKRFWERHKKDILIFLFFFAGITLTFAVWTMVLPQDFFHVQLVTICGMRDMPVCHTLGITGAVAQAQFTNFMMYLTNNLNVLLFAFIFSFIFGAGAMFIIIWNASILGVVIGYISRAIWEIPGASLGFLPHGIPEIAGYICAGLAGGLISAAVLRRVDRVTVRIVVFDALKVLVLGIALIILGSGIEAFL